MCLCEELETVVLQAQGFGAEVPEVHFCANWDHVNWVNPTACASHSGIKGWTRGPRLPKPLEPAPLFSILLLSSFMWSLHFRVSALCLLVNEGSPTSKIAPLT